MTLTAARARELLGYDPESGVLTWLVPHGRSAAGAPAGNVMANGKYFICVDGVGYSCARLAFLIFEGAWPDGYVFPKDGDQTNVRFANLSIATPSERTGHAGMKSNNTSGYRGVSFHKGAGRYRATIMQNGKFFHLGCFDDPAAAAREYDAAALNFFGEFAQLNFPELLRLPDLKMHL